MSEDQRMETLKSRIPEHLVQTVKSSSSVDDLLSSSSSLLSFLVGLPQFHQVKSSKTLTLLSASFSKGSLVGFEGGE